VSAAAQVEGDDADHDPRRTGQLQRGGGLTERHDADEGDQGGAQPGPDRVGDADVDALQRLREQREGDRVAGHGPEAGPEEELIDVSGA
jgi:hypothetical protein